MTEENINHRSVIGSNWNVMKEIFAANTNLLGNRDHRMHYNVIARAIWELLCQEWKVKFVHIYREGNRVADGMASLAVNH
ncbi:hypothetical protein PVK06_005982 [Gossypium arboreum]|uniref:RNase H type-1 domain-containing protein n=1 Tax=Gossypium arboreum TaxID=29729 RepID=A0ABR0QW14_GOSAR|nr:hypothetical protein PVK06_005982 [Gossypium arboreum]